MRDGPSLTPHVASTLFFLDQGGAPARDSFQMAATYLAGLMGKEGRLTVKGLSMPVYTSAEASWVEGMAGNLASRDAWLAYLRAQQLGPSLGWTPADPEFGGWGYSVQTPRKPKSSSERPPLLEPNLSATVFALGALASAHVPVEDPAYQDALVFARRCQNFAEAPDKDDPSFDDGGFFFGPGDPARNKAGASGRDRFGRERFHSYGSMTADGLRVFLRCGLPQDHPRVRAARGWLESRYATTTNPGRFNPDREVLRDATYYYWCWSVAHAFMRLGLSEIDQDGKKVRWAEALAEELVRRQNPDGSWTNSFTDSKEDDPLVATPSAAAAIAIARRTIVAGRR